MTLPVDVSTWRMPLRLPQQQVVVLGSLLSEQERIRADRFHFQRDRDDFIVARARLRQVLSRELQIPPGSVVFHYQASGKPYLHGPGGSATLRFNLSHSGGMALIATTRNHEVGVDIEYMQERQPLMELAERFFSAAEYSALASLEAAQRSAGFFQCWTRKEAYLKGLGLGLGKALDSFDVSCGPGPARLLADRDEPQAVTRWSLEEVMVAGNFKAAVAVAATEIRCHNQEFTAP